MSTRSCIGTIIILLLTIGCRNATKQKDGVILSPEVMQLVLWDMMEADAFTQGFVAKDSSKSLAVESAALQQRIFDLHKISRADFNVSYDYYTANPNKIKPVLDSIISNGERKRNKSMEDRYSGAKPEVK